MPEIKIETKTKELSRKTVLEYSGKCKIRYFWDSHGKLTPFETDSNKNHTITGNLRIEEVETETTFEYSGTHKFIDWELWLDDEKLETDVYEYRINKTCLSVKVAIGWG